MLDWKRILAPGGLSGSFVNSCCCKYNNQVTITFDPVKRDLTMRERGLNFEDAERVFAGVTLDVEDTRKDYGERRFISYGYLAGRMVVIGYTPRGADRHIFSMRKANEREQSRIAPLLEV
jgi:uncharacterized protein